MALASILGGIASGIGNYFGAKEQANAAKRATREQRRQFDYQKGIAEPLYQRGTGANALLDAAYGMGDPEQFNEAFYNSPYYQIQYQGAQDAAERALDRQASASGQLNSGNRLMELTDRNRRLLSQNALNPFMAGLTGISNQGAGVMNSLAGMSQNYGNAAARLTQDQGAATGAGYMGIGNTINNTLYDLQQQGAQAAGMGGQSTSGYGPINLVPNSYYGRR